MKSSCCIAIVGYYEYNDIWKSCFERWEHFCPVSHFYFFTNKGAYDSSDRRVISIECGNDDDFSGILIKGLKTLDTEYVVVSIADFIIDKHVDTDILQKDIDFLKSVNGDYLTYGFGRRRKKAIKRITDEYCEICSSDCYSINASLSIWKVSSLLKCLKKGESSWKMEINYSSRFFSNGFKGYVSRKQTFSYFDAIKKGTIVPKAYRILTKEGLYSGHRKLTPASAMLKFRIKFFLRRILPLPLLNLLRNRNNSLSMKLLVQENRDDSC